LNASAKHVSAYRGATTDAQAWLGGYTRYDLGLAYDFELAGIALRSSVFGRNLTDERYETRNGVQDIGRVYGVELLANF
jgi:outer membrane receptor protein involved in Fe transport